MLVKSSMLKPVSILSAWKAFLFFFCKNLGYPISCSSFYKLKKSYDNWTLGPGRSDEQREWDALIPLSYMDWDGRAKAIYIYIYIYMHAIYIYMHPATFGLASVP